MLREELEGLGFAVEGVDGLVGGGGIKKVGARIAGEEEATVDDREGEDGKEAEENSERLHYITASASEELVGVRGVEGNKSPPGTGLKKVVALRVYTASSTAPTVFIVFIHSTHFP